MEMNSKEKAENFVKIRVIPELARVLQKTDPSASFEISSPNDAFFISDLIFVDVKFQDDPQILSVVVKRYPESLREEQVLLFSTQCHNEVLFYSEYAKHCKNRIPHCYYSFKSSIKDAFLVLENVRKSGYNMCPQSVNIDSKYVDVSLREIAKFHASGYVMKKKQLERFQEILAKITEAKYFPGRFSKFVDLVSTRAIEYLRTIDYDSTFCDKMENVLSRAFQKACIECLQPVEPLATVVHGDFLRNNLLFKKTRDKEMEGMLIDFATIRYATPAIDLVTFFFLSCSKVDRVNEFDRHFGVYCDTLHRILEDNDVDLGDFSREALLDDYKRNAIHGFIIASFFLPMMMYPFGDWSIENFFEREVEENARFSKEIGGNEMSRILADMLLEMRQSGCLEEFLK